MNQSTSSIWTSYSSHYLQQALTMDIRDLHSIHLSRAAPYLNLTDSERHVLIAQAGNTIPFENFRIHRSAAQCIENHACISCWLRTRCCICPYIKPFHSKYRIIVLMHPLEFTRASNTAKLLLRTSTNLDIIEESHRTREKESVSTTSNTDSNAFVNEVDDLIDQLSKRPPFQANNTALFFGNVSEHMELLGKICEENKGNIYTLFPSADAISVQQMLEICARRESACSSSTEVNSKLLQEDNSATDTLNPLLILLDGTWKQAKQLRRCLPTFVPCVQLDLSAVPSFSGIDEALMDSLNDKQRHSMGKVIVKRESTSRSNMTNMTAHDSTSIISGNSESREFASLFHPLRAQTQQGRCSTAEALAYLLIQMGDTSSSEVIFHNIQVLVDAMRSQAGMYTIYNKFSEEQQKKMRILDHSLSAVKRAHITDNVSSKTCESRRLRLCRRYNRNECKSLDAQCKYNHRCENCHGDHPAIECSRCSPLRIPSTN